MNPAFTTAPLRMELFWSEFAAGCYHYLFTKLSYRSNTLGGYASQHDVQAFPFFQQYVVINIIIIMIMNIIIIIVIIIIVIIRIIIIIILFSNSVSLIGF